MNETTMNQYLPKFSREEKAIICKALRDSGHDAHPGILPFIKVDTVLTALRLCGKLHNKIQYRLLRRLEVESGAFNRTAEFPIILNDAKVAKHFGRHPERGKPLNILPKKRVTVGVRWSLPRKDWVVDDNVWVVPAIGLRKDASGWWVRCQYEHWQKVQSWLKDNCM